MTYQITINPALVNQTDYICRWHIEENSSSGASFIKTGTIETPEYHGDISSIADRIIILSQSLKKTKNEDIELIFNFTIIDEKEKPINKMDLFKLYGLLSTKLNPLIIDFPPPLHS